MREYNLAVFIGRFQPFHYEHLAVLEEALKIAEQVIVVIGSYRVAPSIKNPFTFEERREMMSRCLSDQDLRRVEFVGVRDYYYNDNLWLAEVQQKLSSSVHPGDAVTLVGAYKDASSYYLNMFPQWDFTPVQQKKFLNSTDIRTKLFKRDKKMMDFNVYHPDTAFLSLTDMSWYGDVPDPISRWMEEKYFLTSRYSDHVNEWWYYKEYKAEWGDGPFVTADAVVTCSGHLLTIKRKFRPGQNLIAIPGGFVKLTERIEDGMIRELKEETAIDIPKAALRNAIVDSKVFDYPGRSLRGRTITHAYHIALRDGALPGVKEASDASGVAWLPFSDVYIHEDKFFEDHWHIASNFIQGSNRGVYAR
jgi:bifunctional NMN adenylyltransferase/nudix hydrolase